MGNYTSTAINYYRINANNTALAQSASGGSVNAPTEEITAPVKSSPTGVFSSYTSGTRTVVGTATVFTNFAVNQYLYYTDTTTGQFELMGQIEEITDATNLILISPGIVNDPTGTLPILSASYALITNNESIYMRIQTLTGPANGQMQIPNFGLGYWRQNNGLTGPNNPNQSTLEQVSTIGDPLTNAAVITPIAFTFVTMNQFPVASTGTAAGTTYWSNTGLFPAYVWIRVTPQIGSSTSLASQTLYRFTTQENTEALIIEVGTTGGTLQDAGYNNVSATTGVGVGTGGGA
jgi:hypothetical protein